MGHYLPKKMDRRYSHLASELWVRQTLRIASISPDQFDGNSGNFLDGFGTQVVNVKRVNP